VRVSNDEYPTPVGSIIKDENDLKNLKIPDPDADYRFDAIKNAMQEFQNEKAVIIRLRDVFSQPRDLMGFSEFLMSFYTNTPSIHPNTVKAGAILFSIFF